MNKTKIPNNPGRYGPGVVSKEVLEACKEVVETGSSKYGPGVIDDHPDNKRPTAARGKKAPPPHAEGPGEETTPPPPADEFETLLKKYESAEGYVSIEGLKDLLEEMPSSFNRLMGWELARADGPRIGAMKHLMGVESEKESPRQPVLDTLENALEAARKGD